MNANEPCPCGLKNTYADCCGALHDQRARAVTAEQLMRSRYAAFVKQRADYLLATRHPSTRSQDNEAQLSAVFASTRWRGLDILSVENGAPNDTQGYVSFAAHYQDQHGEGVLEERSRFQKEEGAWYYMNAENTLPRNSPCWCGSGKKFKKCHGG